MLDVLLCLLVRLGWRVWPVLFTLASNDVLMALQVVSHCVSLRDSTCTAHLAEHRVT